MLTPLFYSSAEKKHYAQVVAFFFDGAKTLLILSAIGFLLGLGLYAYYLPQFVSLCLLVGVILNTAISLWVVAKVRSTQVLYDYKYRYFVVGLVLSFGYTNYFLWTILTGYAFDLGSRYGILLVTISGATALLCMAVTSVLIRMMIWMSVLTVLTQWGLALLFFPHLTEGALVCTITHGVILVATVINHKKFVYRIELITEHQQLLQSVASKNQSLTEATLAQSRYLSAASHDLRQPMHALALIISDIAHKNTDASIGQTVNAMNGALDNLVMSFEFMQKLSQLDAGIIRPTVRPFPLQQLLSRISSEFQPQMTDKALDWRVLPTKVWVETDEALLKQVLEQLLNHALGMTQQGGVLLGVRQRRIKDSEGNQCVKALLSLYDTGIGMSDEDAMALFRVTNTAENWHNQTQRRAGGLGLGLAIAQRLTKLLNIPIEASSREGRGSQFTLILDTVEPLADALLTPEPENVGLLLNNTQDIVKDKKIILIDDNPIVTDELCTLLERWGAWVTVVLSIEMLEEAYEEEGAFDLIISDYHLGDSDETGIDYIIALRQLQAGIPVKAILITGDTSNDIVHLTTEKDVHLQHKPIRPARFRAFLQQILAS